jgi:hypothetical protein
MEEFSFLVCCFGFCNFLVKFLFVSLVIVSTYLKKKKKKKKQILISLPGIHDNITATIIPIKSLEIHEMLNYECFMGLLDRIPYYLLSSSAQNITNPSRKKNLSAKNGYSYN